MPIQYHKINKAGGIYGLFCERILKNLYQEISSEGKQHVTSVNWHTIQWSIFVLNNIIHAWIQILSSSIDEIFNK